MDLQLQENVREVRLDRFGVSNIIAYGKETIENRALPDFRDGLKPVHRKILWSMYENKIFYNSGYKKAAKIVGMTMGSYHPHGDSSIYEAMVSMANYSQPLVDGQGSWGALNTKPAAMRYTEARLSKYACEVMLNPKYMEVSKFVTNYDGSEQEPLILPALLPNLFINSAEGMAVGAIVGVPSFSLKGVTKILEIELSEKTLTEQHLQKNLTLDYPYGGALLDYERLKTFFITGQSAISLLPNYTFDASKNTITITGGGPHINADKYIAKLQEYDIVLRADDHSDKDTAVTNIVVKLRNNEEASHSVEMLMRKLSDNITLRLNLTKRISNDNIEFMALTPLQYIKKWCDWRKKLESKAQLQIAANLDKKILQNDLLILAANHLDTIVKELKRKEDKLPERIADKLKISVDDAKYLAGRSIASYAALNTAKLIDERKLYLVDSKRAKSIAAAPTEEVINITKKLALQF